MNNLFDYFVVGGGLVGSVLVLCLIEDFDVMLCLFEVGGIGDGWLINVLVVLVLMILFWLNNWVFEIVL